MGFPQLFLQVSQKLEVNFEQEKGLEHFAREEGFENGKWRWLYSVHPNYVHRKQRCKVRRKQWLIGALRRDTVAIFLRKKCCARKNLVFSWKLIQKSWKISQESSKFYRESKFRNHFSWKCHLREIRSSAKSDKHFFSEKSLHCKHSKSPKISQKHQNLLFEKWKRNWNPHENLFAHPVFRNILRWSQWKCICAFRFLAIYFFRSRSKIPKTILKNFQANSAQDSVLVFFKKSFFTLL